MRLVPPAWLVLLSCLVVSVSCMKDSRRLELRDETRALFKHGYEGYMKYAYPADELRPLTCGPLRRDPDPNNVGINDIHANVSMTLVDVLSSLPLLHPTAFPKAVQLVAETVSFDQDVKVQVFEMTIRAMGALLSTYQTLDDLPDDPSKQAEQLGLETEGWTWGSKKAPVDVKRYKGRILELAKDLGERLLPAFGTSTGIPYARVNLRTGVLKGESVETCTAGAGSLLLEFALLSRLTGDGRFETLAHNAYMAIWNRRTPNNLVGNTIGATHGQWLAPSMSGVGAGIDSFFEYGIKAGIMLDDDTYYDIFYDSYAAVQTHIRTTDGFIYRPIQTRLLQPASPSTIDSLSAFLPGMQVLAGDIDSAIKSHLVFWNLWRKHSAMPESWVWAEKRVEWAGYPGRPEFIESTYYLYQATKDPFYLRVGERILGDLKRRTRTRCGFATLKNVKTGELEDRMESFMLSETLKYLYLLFSDTPFPNSNKVFTTEGHPLRIPPSLLRSPSPTRRALRKGENNVCPVYRPFTAGGAEGQGIVLGIEGRWEYEYARGLIYGWGAEGLWAEDPKRMWWDGGFCSIPSTPKFAFEIVLSPLNSTDPTQVPPEDPSPGLTKVKQDPVTGDYVISEIEGLRLGVRWRFDGTGYDVANIGPHRVRQGQQVIITDPTMRDHLPVPTPPPVELSHSPPEVILRFAAHSESDSTFVAQAGGAQAQDSQGSTGGQVFLHAVGATATFGKDFNDPTGVWTLGGKGVRLVIPPGLEGQADDGCHAFTLDQLGLAGRENEIDRDAGFVLLLVRGGCTFLEKLVFAKQVGAAGVLVIGLPPDEGRVGEGWEEGLIRPSADADSDSGSGSDSGSPGSELELKDVGMVYTEHVVGEVLRRVGSERVLSVQLLRMEGDETHSPAGVGTQAKAEARERTPAEGRLSVGGYGIWNLRVVDGSTSWPWP